MGRQKQGVYANLLRELQGEDPETFRRFHRLDIDQFKEVLQKIGPVIQRQDTVMRCSISPGERLAATLRFLATGKLNKIIGKPLRDNCYIKFWGRRNRFTTVIKYFAVLNFTTFS